MDSFRIKRVVNEVVASLQQHRDLDNFDQHVRKTCGQVAFLLLEGQAGYNRLKFVIPPHYQGLHTSAQLAECAVFFAAIQWNVDRAVSGVVG